jgi:ankyrin repeat protein
LLVENKCDINICHADGQTQLHRACSKGYVDIAGNININQCNKWMKTPLILAVEGRHTNVVKLLVENKNKWSLHKFVALINITISFQ